MLSHSLMTLSCTPQEALLAERRARELAAIEAADQEFAARVSSMIWISNVTMQAVLVSWAVFVCSSWVRFMATIEAKR